MKQPKYPKTLYVTIENAGTADEYLNPLDAPEGHAVVGQNVTIAVYQLVEMAVVTAKAELVKK